MAVGLDVYWPKTKYIGQTEIILAKFELYWLKLQFIGQTPPLPKKVRSLMDQHS
jgi:hypothetical protein